MIRNAGPTAQLSHRFAVVLETIGLQRSASRAAGAFGQWPTSEALAPARGAALGALLGGACWGLVVVLAWTLAG